MSGMGQKYQTIYDGYLYNHIIMYLPTTIYLSIGTHYKSNSFIIYGVPSYAQFIDVLSTT